MASDEPGVITSPWPKLDEGLARGKTLWGYVDARISEVLRKFGDKTLLIDGTTDEKYSYSEFQNLVRKTAVIFRDHYQVTKDSVVLICSRNNLYFPVPVYATVALGSVPFSIPAYSHAVIPGFLESEPSVPVIFCDDDNLSFVKEYVASCKSKPSKGSPKIVLLEGHDPKGEFETLRDLIDQCVASEEALSSIGKDLASVDVDSEAVVFFSSASTGPPKPISHCHRGLISVSYNTNRLGTELEADEMKLFNVDLGHMGGFCFFLANISSGSTLIVFSNFNPERLLPTISRYRVNHLGLYAKDAIFLSKVDDWSMYDLSCVREIFATASIFPTSVAKRLKEMFSALTAPICQAYGSTELILAATSVECGAKDEVEAGIGLLVPYVKAKVVDLVTQEPLGPNEYGELWIHSPFRFIGYRNRPDLNAELISPDGWYKTGDYGYHDEKQRLHIIDRIKDLIRLPSGDVVSPSAIENIVLQHPGVAQVGVAGVPWPFGSPNPTDAEVPRAFIIEKPDANLSPGEVVKFLEEKTSKPQLQLSGGAELINTMITSPGGKVYRYKLRADFIKKTNLQKEQSAAS